VSNATKQNNSGNGVGGILLTLAKSGDKWVQLLIIGGIILNTIMTKQNGNGISNNTRELDILRYNVARQVRSVYDNQNFLFDFVDEVRASQDKIQTKLDIPHASVTPFPRQHLPEFQPYPYP